MITIIVSRRHTICPDRAKQFGPYTTANFARWLSRLVWFVFALCAITPALAGTWTQRGALNTPRASASVALLPNGLVLVAGGGNTGGALNSAELYDPATGMFTITGSLTTARQNATATMLTNGTVLIAGGTNSSGSLATAEIYNPVTASFSTTGSMTAARGSATATLLADGRVLLAGGANGTTAIASAELYDTASGQFTPTGSLQTARSLATATLLTDGRVLIAGGNPSGVFSDSIASTEIYDPFVGMFGAGASLTVSRESATATMLPSGKVLIAGGYSIVARTAQVLTSAELYDPIVNTSIATGAMTNARFGAIAALLPSGDVLIAGGSNNVFSGNPLADAEAYSATSGTFSSAGSMTNARDGSASAILLPNAQVLVIGGIFSAQAESYDASNGTFALTAPLPGACQLPIAAPLPDGRVLFACNPIGQIFDPAVGSFTATGTLNADRTGTMLFADRPAATFTLLGNGQVLAVGGRNADGTAVDVPAEQYDPVAGTFTLVGSPSEPRFDHSATLLADGRVLLSGGLTSDPDSGQGMFLFDTDVYDPATQTFTENGDDNGDLLHASAGATATLLPSGKVLIVGGLFDIGASETSADLYDINALPRVASTGAPLFAHDDATATLLPNGKVLIAGGYTASAELYDPATGVFSMTGSMAQERESATATLLQNGKVLISGGFELNGDGDNVALSSAELYDPATGQFSAAGSMTAERASATATLLPNGKVLLAGGFSGVNGDGTVVPQQSAELYDPGTGFSDSRRALIRELSLSAAAQPLALNLAGSGFRATTEQSAGALIGSEASSGDSQSAATNYPLLQLRRVDNDQQFFIGPDPAQPWTDTSFTTSTLSGLPLGFYRATLFVNAIPSESHLFSISPSVLNIAIVGGDQQTAPANTQFTQPLQAIVTDTSNNPIGGVIVTITCSPAANGACIFAHSALVSDANGLVSATVIADDEPGSYIVAATISGSAPANFHLSNSAGPATNLSTSGTPQSTQVNTAFASTLQITVTDAFNNPVPGTVVTFSDPTNGASAGLSKSSVTTDNNGEAAITATANTIAGSYVVTASVGALSTQFSLTNKPGPAVNMTALNGPTFTGTAGLALATPPAVMVSDALGNPIAGVAVTFATGNNSGSITDENPLTDSTGTATAGSWTLAADPGTNTLQASAVGLTGSPVQFSAVGSASVDVAVSVTNNHGFVQFGHTLDYVIVVTSAGPSNAHNVQVTDLLPAQLDAANANWVCVPAIGATCTASGNGNLVNQVANVPTGGSVTFVLSATVLNNQGVNNDTITNTVSASVDGDTDTSNNTMTAITQAVIFRNSFEAGGDGSH